MVIKSNKLKKIYQYYTETFFYETKNNTPCREFINGFVI